MKVDFREYGGSFGIELVPETPEETLRAARLGLTSKKGARVFVSFSETDARICVNFSKHKNKYPVMRL